jgi:hypothetical protein
MGRRRHRDAWEAERALDPDGAWLRDTYGLEFAEREYLKGWVERGEAVPDERLREPAAAYARRMLKRPLWRRNRGLVFVAVAFGLLLGDVVLLVTDTAVVTEELVLHSLLLVSVLGIAVSHASLRTRKLRRAERRNSADEP